MFCLLRIRKKTLLAAAALAALAVTLLTLGAAPGRAAEASALAEVPQQTVYLTFDDGPSANTPALLDVLAEKGVQATFFVTAQCPDHLDDLTRAAAQGNVIALHTYSHEYSEIYASTAAFWADIDRLNEVIREKTGQYSTLLRFPGGSSNSVSRHYGGSALMKELAAQCGERGIAYFDWNVDTKDAEGGTRSAQSIVQRALDGAEGLENVVILMHDGGMNKTAPEAAAAIIDAFRARGCAFDTLNHLTVPVHHTL